MTMIRRQWFEVPIAVDLRWFVAFAMGFKFEPQNFFCYFLFRIQGNCTQSITLCCIIK
ncbi:hypothetical protein PAHAL_4G350300 [Panicum hallii]|uniref:Uncharacterized protein n=1 Tax=Panicum hallii TaxID=206008 RepID=A0A2T8JF46_9POAL|nr:hypothetical protein PAHAL_4G350300 [Panicum hallii]